MIAGGYDPRLEENVSHHLELYSLATSLGVNRRVVFLRSISNEERVLLLKSADILLYTPENEHFGIVPVEGMYLGCVVIACNSGGPLESIRHGETGYLLKPEVDEWADKIGYLMKTERFDDQRLITDQSQTRVSREQMKVNAKKRV